ncbi:MAG: GNAT family N-acetyltransferase [Pseudoclavibacter sp.]
MAKDLSESAPRAALVPYRRRMCDYRAFTCGEPEMDRWLAEYAGQAERKNTARTFIAIDSEQKSREVWGYFTLCNAQVEPADAAATSGRYSVPATLLARLAVATSKQHTGLGGNLLIKAMETAVQALHYSGSRLFIVDALNDQAARFYERYGFKRFAEDQNRLFIATRTLQRAFDLATPTL